MYLYFVFVAHEDEIMFQWNRDHTINDHHNHHQFVSLSSILRTCVVFFWTVTASQDDDQCLSSHEYYPATGRRRQSGTNMFNLYSSMNRRGGEVEEKKEIQTTGHDRFYQTERSRCAIDD